MSPLKCPHWSRMRLFPWNIRRQRALHACDRKSWCHLLNDRKTSLCGMSNPLLRRNWSSAASTGEILPVTHNWPERKDCPESLWALVNDCDTWFSVKVCRILMSGAGPTEGCWKSNWQRKWYWSQEMWIRRLSASLQPSVWTDCMSTGSDFENTGSRESLTPNQKLKVLFCPKK